MPHYAFFLFSSLWIGIKQYCLCMWVHKVIKKNNLESVSPTLYYLIIFTYSFVKQDIPICSSQKRHTDEVYTKNPKWKVDRQFTCVLCTVLITLRIDLSGDGAGPHSFICCQTKVWNICTFIYISMYSHPHVNVSIW
jgi:hypothetical protein